MKIWGLYSSRVDPYHDHELLEVFDSEELAETVRANLIGKQARRDMHGWNWEDDEDFPDLLVRPLTLRRQGGEV